MKFHGAYRVRSSCSCVGDGRSLELRARLKACSRASAGSPDLRHRPWVGGLIQRRTSAKARMFKFKISNCSTLQSSHLKLRSRGSHPIEVALHHGTRELRPHQARFDEASTCSEVKRLEARATDGENFRLVAIGRGPDLEIGAARRDYAVQRIAVREHQVSHVQLLEYRHPRWSRPMRRHTFRTSSVNDEQVKMESGRFRSTLPAMVIVVRTTALEVSEMELPSGGRSGERGSATQRHLSLSLRDPREWLGRSPRVQEHGRDEPVERKRDDGRTRS
ncbi:hypothetical protein BHM03_00012971 [Ensete ventricosum]|nr:hypothetical protein BHM03_00012971 [Ensete ventricosum]